MVTFWATDSKPNFLFKFIWCQLLNCNVSLLRLLVRLGKYLFSENVRSCEWNGGIIELWTGFDKILEMKNAVPFSLNFGPYNWIRHYMHFVWCFVLTYVVEGEWLIIYLFSGMIVTSALIIWKGLMCVTGSESPVVVVLSGSMEPGFKRVSWEYFWFQEFVTYWFPQVRWVFTHCMVRGRWF